MNAKILLLVVLCVAYAIAQEEPTEEAITQEEPAEEAIHDDDSVAGSPVDVPNEEEPSDVTTVSNDAGVPSDDNEDVPNEEVSGNDDAAEPNEEPSEPQAETNDETGSSDTDNQENPLPNENTDTQNNDDGDDEVAEAATNASPVEHEDSNEDGETDSNPPNESNDDSPAMEPSDAADAEEPSAVTAAPETDAPASPTPAPEFTCQSVGRFPHPDSCEKYYYCWDTVHSHAVFTCPKVFDPVSKLCSNNYAVCPLAPTCEADKQILPFPDDKTAFFECRLESDKDAVTPVYEIRKEECEKGREFDAELGYCRLITPTEWVSSESGSSERFECNGVGTFIDYSSETHYIECVIKSVCKGTLKAVRRKCPKYTVFSAADMQCIPL